VLLIYKVLPAVTVTGRRYPITSLPLQRAANDVCADQVASISTTLLEVTVH